MVFFPLVFFSFILYNIIKRNGFDLSACITLMYVIISVFSVILSNYDYDFAYSNYSKVEIGVIPTFVYCFSIAICIYPFYKYNSNKARTLLTIKNTQFLDILVYTYLATFVILIAIFWKDILFILAYGDMGELRQMQYEGILTNALDAKGGFVRRIGGILSIIGDGAYFMIPIFFYTLSRLNKKKIYLFFILLGSISPVLLGFVQIDRSKTAFWICIFVMSYFMFKPYLVSKAQKKTLKQMFMIVGGFLLFYLAIVTISRFGDREEGTSGGLIVYLGQPFINFCDIWNNIDSDHFFVSRVLPLITFVFQGSSGTKEIVDYLMSSASRTGLHLNVFFTFVGMFLVDMGRIAAVLVPLLLYFIINNVIGKYTNRTTNTLSSMIVIFGFAVILQCGIIIYFYTTVPRALAFWFFIYYAKRFLK